jgi:hypothetical protein
MIEKEFVPYEESLGLKELGFDEPCFGYWYTEQEEFKKIDIQLSSIGFLEGEPDYILAPTYSQAFRWFREKHQLIHHMYWVYKKTYVGVDWIFHIKGINMTNNNVVPHDETRFETYEEAELACLKKLIEIVKGGNK